MKKFSVFLSLFMASFFLLSYKVNAANYNFNASISENFLNFFTNNLNSAKQVAEDFIQSHPTYPGYYFITYNVSSGNYYEVDILKEFPGTGCFKSSNYIQCNFKFISGRYSEDFSSANIVTNSISSYFYTYGAPMQLYHILYSNFNLNLRSSNYNSDTYTFKYNDNSYVINNQENNYLPTFYDLALSFDLLTAPDETPILTTFYTIIGSKIGWLGEQIINSYVYLAIIGVFILIFIIELIRRYLL